MPLTVDYEGYTPAKFAMAYVGKIQRYPMTGINFSSTFALGLDRPHPCASIARRYSDIVVYSKPTPCQRARYNASCPGSREGSVNPQPRSLVVCGSWSCLG